MTKETDLQTQLNNLTEFAFELYKEARLNAELANEHIAKELYPFKKKNKYNSEFVHMVAEHYNHEMDAKVQFYIENNYIPYLRANFDNELLERIGQKK